MALKSDVKSNGDLKNIVEATIAEFGELDILINNAQELARGALLDCLTSAPMRQI